MKRGIEGEITEGVLMSTVACLEDGTHASIFYK
jgi:hypothetical protein